MVMVQAGGQYEWNDDVGVDVTVGVEVRVGVYVDVGVKVGDGVTDGVRVRVTMVSTCGGRRGSGTGVGDKLKQPDIAKLKDIAQTINFARLKDGL